MSTDIAEPAYYARRTLEHVRVLARSPRGSATPAEKQAAEYVEAQLKSMGVSDVQQQSFSGERSMWLFISLVLGLALVGHAAYWLLRTPMGSLPAVIVAVAAFAMSGYLIWRRFSFENYPLRNLLPLAPSQNVNARLPPRAEPRQRLVLVAHLDSHRAVFWFATDLLVRIFTPLSTATIFGVYLAIPVYLLAALTHWQAFTWLGIILAILHFLGWFTGVTADLGRYSPGANDNASSVGTLLALAERLIGQPLENTELWLAFTGCEETGGDGIQALLRENQALLKDSLFINFEMVGIGEQLSYIRTEGNLRRYSIPQDVEDFVKEIGQPNGLQALDTPFVGASTECSILLKHGYKAVCLTAHHPDSPILPEWHRLTDTPDRLQVNALDKIQSVAWDILQRFDQRLA